MSQPMEVSRRVYLLGHQRVEELSHAGNETTQWIRWQKWKAPHHGQHRHLGEIRLRCIWKEMYCCI